MIGHAGILSARARNACRFAVVTTAVSLVVVYTAYVTLDALG